ncbi:MAG: hypothetical protein IPG94_06450 [Kineosporiaceae bacterium]|nr:hypothetical protein [Kineosporiaceae bacterium]
MRNNPSVALRELLPPTASDSPEAGTGQPGTEGTDSIELIEAAAPLTRRQARPRRRRRSPLAVGFVIVAAAATGSVAALMTSSEDASTGAYPSVPPVPPAPSSAVDGPTTSPAQAEAARSVTSSPRLSGPGLVTQRAARASSDPGRRPAGARRISDVPDRPAAVIDWPTLTYTLKAADGPMEPPSFPAAPAGFAVTSSSTSTVTITRGRYFTAVGKLPVRTAAYDVCRRQRFFVRWLAIDPAAVVAATLVDERVSTVQNRPVHGSAGWMSTFGCVQPALRIAPSTLGPGSATVIVETQVWQRR